MYRLLISSVALALAWPAEVLAGPMMGLPTVSLGSNPHRSFMGELGSPSDAASLMDIPEGQDFIITAYNVQGSEDIQVYRDGEAVLTLPMMYHTYTRTGEARLRVEGGATLSVQRSGASGTAYYYLQGYLVQEGGPERFVSGSTPGGGTHTVWTTEEDRDFIVRTMIVGTSWCNFARDGVDVSSGSFPFSGGPDTAFGNGKGALVLPAGSTLTLTHGMEGEACEYFIEGRYVEP